MSLIFFDGFDAGNDGKGWDDLPQDYPAASGRNGTAAARTVAGGGNTMGRTVPASDVYYLGFAWRGSSSMTGTVVAFREGATTHCRIDYQGTPVKFVAKNAAGTVVGTASYPISNYAWYYLEVKVVVHDTVGEIVLKVNGVTEINATGLDTRSGLTGVVNYLHFAPGDADTYHEDMWLCDDAGSAPWNTFLGDCRAETLRPNGAGNSTQFTPSAGSNWQNVDDASADDDTTYNSSNTAGHKDLYTLENLNTVNGLVYGVHLKHRIRKDDAGSRTARRLLRTASTDYEGADIAVSDSYVSTWEVIQANPNTTNAWTVSEVNSLEIGQKVQT